MEMISRFRARFAYCVTTALAFGAILGSTRAGDITYSASAGRVISTLYSDDQGSFRHERDGSWRRFAGSEVIASATDQEFVGVAEFDLRNLRLLTGSRVNLALPDSGGRQGARTTVTTYSGNGRLDASDVSPDGPVFLNLTRPGTVTTVHEATSVAAAGAGEFLGFSFKSTYENDGFGVRGARPAGAEEGPRLEFADAATEILRNSVQVMTSGRSIQAVFSPKGSLGAVPLDALAQALGVVRFQWLSRVVSLPASWKGEIWENASVKDGQLVAERIRSAPIPMTDPLVGRNDYFVYTDAQGKMHTWQDPRQPSQDGKIFYYTDAELKSYSTAGSLTFFDSPSQELGAFLPGEFIEFDTWLVGEYADGSYVSWDGLGTKFRWKSDGQHDPQAPILGQPGQGGAIFLGYSHTPDPGVLPPSAGGGVFDVRLDSTAAVPEPAGVVMLGLGVVASIVCGRRLRRSA